MSQSRFPAFNSKTGTNNPATIMPRQEIHRPILPHHPPFHGPPCCAGFSTCGSTFNRDKRFWCLILGVQDRLQSQVYLIHLPFWGSKIGYKARCIWYTCHFGGPRSATKPGVSDTPAILGIQDRLQNQNSKIQDPKSKPQDPESKMGGSERSEIICWKGLKSSVYDFRPLVGAYPQVWPFQTLRVSSWGYICWACINVQFYVITRMTLATHFKLQYRSLLFCSLLLGDSCFLFHQFTSHHHWHLTIKATSSPNSMLLHWPVPNSLLRTCIK